MSGLEGIEATPKSVVYVPSYTCLPMAKLMSVAVIINELHCTVMQ